MGAVRLPKILVLTIDAFVSAQTVSGTVSAHFPESALCKFEMTNPWRYGVALLTATPGAFSSHPLPLLY